MKYVSVFIFMLAARTCFSQDLNFTQFYEQPLLRNPAFCGRFNGSFRAQSIFRNQWQKIPVPYRTGGLSAGGKFPYCNQDFGKYSFWAAGLQLTYDIAGDSRLTRWQVLGSVSRHINLDGEGNTYLIGSGLVGYVNSHFNPNELKWGDEYVNGIYTPNSTSQVLKNSKTGYPEVGAGIMFTHRFGYDAEFYAGFAAYHLPISSNNTFGLNSATQSNPNLKLSLNGGIEFPLNEQRMNVFGDYILQDNYKQQAGTASILKTGKFSTFMIGALLTFNPKNGEVLDEDKTSVGFGAIYRWDDAIAPIVRIELYQWNFGLSYDVNISKLNTASQARGGFEFTLGYRLNNCSNPQTRCSN